MIDFHTHLAFHKIYPDNFLGGLFGSKDKSIPLTKRISMLKLFLKDDYADKMVKQMDDANISKSVLLIVDDNGYLGESEESLEAIYDRHYEVLKKHPNRFVVFAGFHPERENGMELLQKGVEEYGFKGIKLYPPYGYQLGDSGMEACLQYANNAKLPVLIHTGFSVDGLINENAEPELLIEVVDTYPHVKFIMGHAGYKLDNPIVRQLLEKGNVYADISGFQNASTDILKLIFEKKYNEKILFGTDWPITNLMKSLKDLVQYLSEVYEESGQLDKLAWENVMNNNAVRLLD